MSNYAYRDVAGATWATAITPTWRIAEKSKEPCAGVRAGTGCRSDRLHWHNPSDFRLDWSWFVRWSPSR